MGTWNGTCAVSQLHITNGQEVVIFILTENRLSYSYCYSSSYFYQCPMPFYGFYNDVGGAEDCYGIGLPILIEAIKSVLTELEQGENEYHDIPAKRNTFNVEELFNLDHEGRLFIHGRVKSEHKTGALKYHERNKDIGLGEKCVPVMVHKGIFDYILEEWEQEQYTGWEKPYFNYKFKDLLPGIPEWIERLKLKIEELKQRSSFIKYNICPSLSPISMSLFKHKEKNVSVEAHLIDDYFGLQFHEDLLVNSRVLIKSIIDNQDPTELITEMLKGFFINHFMEGIRKPWIKQVGGGSQQNDHNPYHILINSMACVLQEEKDKWGNDG